MSDFYAKNLSLLKYQNSKFVELLESANISPNFSIESSKVGHPTLAFSDDKKKFYLIGRKDPIKQAEIIFKSYLIPPKSHIVVLGSGLGYLEKIIQAKSNYKKIHIVIHDISLFKLAMIANDLSGIFKSGIEWLIGKSLLEINNYFLSQFGSVFPENVVIIHNRGIERLNTEYYSAVAKTIARTIVAKSSEILTLHKCGNVFRNNSLYNVNRIVKYPHVIALKDIFKDRPAILIAAGPSLDKNIEFIKGMENRAVIICVATALKKLLQYGIKPHLTAAIDASESSSKYVLDIESDIPLIADMETHPKTISEYKGPIFLWPPKHKPITYWVHETAGNFPEMEKSASVGHMIYYIAQMLGCKPVILAGYDFAFTGEKAHAEGCNQAWSKLPPNLCKIDGWKDDKVVSYGGFVTFLSLLEQIVAKSGIRVIDATEGGAHKEGMEKMTLKEAIELFCKYEFNAKSEIKNIYANGVRIKQSALDRMVSDLLSNTELASKYADSVIGGCRQLIKCVKYKRGDDKVNKSLGEINKQYNKLNEFKHLWKIAEATMIDIALSMQSAEPLDLIKISKLYIAAMNRLKVEFAAINKILIPS